MFGFFLCLLFTSLRGKPLRSGLARLSIKKADVAIS